MIKTKCKKNLKTQKGQKICPINKVYRLRRRRSTTMSNVIVKWKNYKDMDELVEAVLNGENKERIINAKAMNEDIKRFSLEEISIINILNICANMGKNI